MERKEEEGDVGKRYLSSQYHHSSVIGRRPVHPSVTDCFLDSHVTSSTVYYPKLM